MVRQACSELVCCLETVLAFKSALLYAYQDQMDPYRDHMDDVLNAQLIVKMMLIFEDVSYIWETRVLLLQHLPGFFVFFVHLDLASIIWCLAHAVSNLYDMTVLFIPRPCIAQSSKAYLKSLKVVGEHDATISFGRDSIVDRN